MKINRESPRIAALMLLVASPAGFLFSQGGRNEPAMLRGPGFSIAVEPKDGSYMLLQGGQDRPVVVTNVAALVDHRWLPSIDYPRHNTAGSTFRDEFGEGDQLVVTHSGLPAQPDLICILRMHKQPSFAEVQVQVSNTTGKPITVQAIRVLKADGEPRVNIGGEDARDRVLSDSFSEDRPNMEIHDLAQAADGMHRAVGSQLIYNLDSKRSLFLGALTSEKWLTVLRLHVANVREARITAYEVDSTGTTELTKENSLSEAPSQDQIELSLPVEAGKSLDSERLLISVGSDYHEQLESYGAIIRRLHHARVNAPTPMGWWSWTAYYFGLNDGTALTNANWLAQHVKKLGYTFFHIDEGYQYARGEYATPDAALYPNGLKTLYEKIRGLGLIAGIWTAPFEVSERSWVYEHHKDWLVHNANGQPIHAGYVTEVQDRLYVLDTTNPGAQEYLQETYRTLVKEWGIRYIKMDFMEDSAIEGFYYRPHTTALEAQRIGLKIIREAVGEDVVLDKDGSTMLNPVGIVDAGRISVDTGHTFEASKVAAPGIAARYYMNRNFFISDPDAFTISRQTVTEQEWHGGKRPLTLDEGRISIALAAVSGGMWEIGDDLPTLSADADRLALVQNRDLINVARLGRAAAPLDLMSYAPEDLMSGVFLLRESKRQAILTVFNWTEKSRRRRFVWADLGLRVGGNNQVFDAFGSGQVVSENEDSVAIELPPRSVRVLKIVDTSVPAAAPAVSARVPETVEAGKATEFSAQVDSSSVPAIGCHWEFGDGVSDDGNVAHHAYTHAGNFSVRLTVEGIDGLSFQKTFLLKVTGGIDTQFAPSRKQRFLGGGECRCGG